MSPQSKSPFPGQSFQVSSGEPMNLDDNPLGSTGYQCASGSTDAGELNERQTDQIRQTMQDGPSSEQPQPHALARTSTNDVTTNENLPDSAYSSQSPSPHTHKQKSVHEVGNWGRRKVLKQWTKTFPEAAIHRSRDWKVLFSNDLWNIASASARSGCTPKVYTKLVYLGTTESDAKLYLVLYCERRAARRMRRFVAQRHVMEETKSIFQLHVEASEPVALRGEFRHSMGDNFSRTLCGTLVFFRPYPSSDRRISTFGGLVTIRTLEGQKLIPRVLGMTTDHIFAVSEATAQVGNVSNDSDHDNEDGDDDYDDAEFSIESDLTSDSSMETPAESPVHSQQLPPWPPTPDYIRLSSAYGEASTNGSLRDWHLLDGVFVDLNRNPSQINARHKVSFQLPVKPLDANAELKVEVMAGVSGVKSGILTGQRSSIITKGGNIVETYDLTLPSGNLQPGDSGSWILNPTTGEVYGHVTALDIFGEAYVVPMVDTLEDVKSTLGVASATLASDQDIALCIAVPNMPQPTTMDRAAGEHRTGFASFGPSLPPRFTSSLQTPNPSQSESQLGSTYNDADSGYSSLFSTRDFSIIDDVWDEDVMRVKTLDEQYLGFSEPIPLFSRLPMLLTPEPSEEVKASKSGDVDYGSEGSSTPGDTQRTVEKKKRKADMDETSIQTSKRVRDTS